jgi:serine/threonine-protein kinase RsbW
VVSQLAAHSHSAVDEDVVRLTVPADVGYLGVLRTATAGLAARLHFALDEIEDLRIAVDEACAMLLAIATPKAELQCQFAVTDDALTVEVTVPTVVPARLPATSSFAWKVLTALTSEASAETTGEQATIRLVTRRLERGPITT